VSPQLQSISELPEIPNQNISSSDTNVESITSNNNNQHNNSENGVKRIEEQMPHTSASSAAARETNHDSLPKDNHAVAPPNPFSKKKHSTSDKAGGSKNNNNHNHNKTNSNNCFVNKFEQEQLQLPQQDVDADGDQFFDAQSERADQPNFEDLESALPASASKLDDVVSVTEQLEQSGSITATTSSHEAGLDSAAAASPNMTSKETPYENSTNSTSNHNNNNNSHVNGNNHITNIIVTNPSGHSECVDRDKWNGEPSCASASKRVEPHQMGGGGGSSSACGSCEKDDGNYNLTNLNLKSTTSSSNLNNSLNNNNNNNSSKEPDRLVCFVLMPPPSAYSTPRTGTTTTTTKSSSSASSHPQNAQQRRPIQHSETLKSVTTKLTALYSSCSQTFSYRTGLAPRRVLTKCSEPAFNGGNKNFLYFLTNSGVLRSILGFFIIFWNEMKLNFYFFVVVVALDFRHYWRWCFKY